MLSVFFIFPVRAKNTFGKKKDKVTRLHFYDLNKNGRMDTYENPSAPVEYRVEHLLSQMTLEEKVGQMAQYSCIIVLLLKTSPECNLNPVIFRNEFGFINGCINRGVTVS